jgi:uncharacterized protein (TIGR03032 family)
MATNAKTTHKSIRSPGIADLEALWHHHHGQWRHPAQITSQWNTAVETDSSLLQFTVKGNWWEILEKTQSTLLVTREYEHLIIALSVRHGRPDVTFMPLPHPSGLAVDRAQNTVYVASTRNPNQVYELAPVNDLTDRLDVKSEPIDNRPLVPVSSRFLPGCLYMHDLAFIGDDLYANAVGQNAIVRLSGGSRYERVWWPQCIEADGDPVFGQNHIQLNSIAAATSVNDSFYSASCDRLSVRRPGHKNFPVDKRGVIFSGATREPMGRGLTRPHSARLHEQKVWVDNSGYGQLGFIENEALTVVSQLPGWTRGLCFIDRYAIVGSSRVIPRFANYAPGLDVNKSLCGIHAVDTKTGEIAGSLLWPYGNQIFAIDWLPNSVATGFVFSAASGKPSEREKRLFYTFSIDGSTKEEIG